MEFQDRTVDPFHDVAQLEVVRELGTVVEQVSGIDGVGAFVVLPRKLDNPDAYSGC